MQTWLPSLPIPEPLRGAEAGSFAYNTIVVRLPEIARRMLAENDFPPDVLDRVQALIDELPSAKVRRLQDHQAPDTAAWDGYLARVPGLDWLQIPWFLAENYFYRRILEATGYFAPGPGYGVDPNRYQKQQALDSLPAALESFLDIEKDLNPADAVQALIYTALWGNQADLSLWPVNGPQGSSNRPQHNGLQAASAYLVVNQVQVVIDYLFARQQPRRLDFVLDNTGVELGCDLLLADALLEKKLAGQVHLHAKAHPTFVSDALPADILATLQYLSGSGSPAARRLGERLLGRLEAGQVSLHSDYFWNSPLPGWEMPAALRQVLSGSQLVISKGDANYRRLLGDAHWDPAAPFSEIVSYYPAPLLALRTLKSDAVAGLQPGQAERLDQQDPNWKTSGRWGIIETTCASSAS